MLIWPLVILHTLLPLAEPRPARAQIVRTTVRDTTDWDVSAWRAWFTGRRFALDPWFFLAAGDVGSTRCPPDTRLSLAAVDSAAVTFSFIDDRHSPPVVRARCRVPYASLRGRAAHGALEDGRVMWQLRTRSGRRTREASP